MVVQQYLGCFLVRPQKAGIGYLCLKLQGPVISQSGDQLGFASCGCCDLSEHLPHTSWLRVIKVKGRPGREEHVCTHIFYFFKFAQWMNLLKVFKTFFLTSAILCVFSQWRITPNVFCCCHSSPPQSLSSSALCCDLMINGPELACGAVSPSEGEAV